MNSFRQRTYKTQGIVLKRINFGETDKIITLFTKHYGKIKVLAKGIRKVTSRKGGSLEPFTLLTLFSSRGRNFDILSEVDVIESFSSWRDDLKKVMAAYYFCEIVDKLTPEAQQERVLFDLLCQFLYKLEDNNPQELMREFACKAMITLGFGIPATFGQNEAALGSYIESIAGRKINSGEILKEN